MREDYRLVCGPLQGELMIKTPEKGKTDLAIAVAKGLVSAIPIAGGALVELGDLYLNPLERRRNEWVIDVSKALNQIRAELDMIPEQLQENEHFISALYKASEVAIRTHQSEKRVALRNALVSSAAPAAADDEEAAIFIRYIDEFGPMHLKALHHLSHQAGQFARFDKLAQVCDLLSRLLDRTIERSLLRTLLQDLDSRFLIRLGDLEELPEFKSKRRLRALGESGIQPISVTRRGKSFLSYIRADQL